MTLAPVKWSGSNTGTAPVSGVISSALTFPAMSLSRPILMVVEDCFGQSHEFNSFMTATITFTGGATATMTAQGTGYGNFFSSHDTRLSLGGTISITATGSFFGPSAFSISALIADGPSYWPVGSDVVSPTGDASSPPSVTMHTFPPSITPVGTFAFCLGCSTHRTASFSAFPPCSITLPVGDPNWELEENVASAVVSESPAFSGVFDQAATAIAVCVVESTAKSITMDTLTSAGGNNGLAFIMWTVPNSVVPVAGGARSWGTIIGD